MLILVHMNLLMSKRKDYSKEISPSLNAYFYRKIILIRRTVGNEGLRIEEALGGEAVFARKQDLPQN